jgi:hypothetical protein
MSTHSEYLRMKTEGDQHHTFNIDILGDFVSFSYFFNFFRQIKVIKLQ